MISKDTEKAVAEMMDWLPSSYKKALNELIHEGAKLEKELKLAQHTEQHLKSAEKVLVEKDAEITVLQETLASKERQLRRVRELLNKSLADEVLKWEAIVEQKNSDIIRMRTELDRALQRCHATNSSSMQVIASLREERDKYREALRDLVGTLNARADHDRELAGAVKSVLNG